MLRTGARAAGRQASREGDGERRPAKVPRAEWATRRVEHGRQVDVCAGPAERPARSASRAERLPGARVAPLGRETEVPLGVHQRRRIEVDRRHDLDPSFLDARGQELPAPGGIDILAEALRRVNDSPASSLQLAKSYRNPDML